MFSPSQSSNGCCSGPELSIFSFLWKHPSLWGISGSVLDTILASPLDLGSNHEWEFWFYYYWDWAIGGLSDPEMFSVWADWFYSVQASGRGDSQQPRTYPPSVWACYSLRDGAGRSGWGCERWLSLPGCWWDGTETKNYSPRSQIECSQISLLLNSGRFPGQPGRNMIALMRNTGKLYSSNWLFLGWPWVTMWRTYLIRWWYQKRTDQIVVDTFILLLLYYYELLLSDQSDLPFGLWAESADEKPESF